MVTTSEILPCFLLRPFIRCFTCREVDSQEIKIYRPMFAAHEFSITFNLVEKKYGYIKPASENLISPEQIMRSEMVISGITSQFSGYMTGPGQFRVFSIYFKPTGFYRIFGIPAIYFANRIEEDEYTCRKNMEVLHQQLRVAGSFFEMTGLCETYLIKQLKDSRAKDPYNSILSASEYIIHGSNHSIEKLAFDANMSLKTFERKFTAQVGSSPKLFARIVRFNKAISLKMGDSRKTWTAIAHECGYFDQMHFIKDFKLFSGNTPGAFFKDTPPVSENLVDFDGL